MLTPQTFWCSRNYLASPRKFIQPANIFSMRENIVLIPEIYCVSCADFWVSSILGMPACRHYVIDPLLAASAPPGGVSISFWLHCSSSSTPSYVSPKTWGLLLLNVAPLPSISSLQAASITTATNAATALIDGLCHQTWNQEWESACGSCGMPKKCNIAAVFRERGTSSWLTDDLWC